MNTKLSADLSRNTVNLRSILSNTSDLNLKYAKAAGINICIVSVEGMINTNTLANLIYSPINTLAGENKMELSELTDKIENVLLLAGEQKNADNYDDLVNAVMSGFTAILIDGLDYAICVGTQGYEKRSIEEPSTNMNLRGSHEGFIEVVRTNMSLVRRRIKSPTLVFNMLTLGDRSNTDVCVCYLKDKAPAELIERVTKKLEEIPLNTILEGGYIQPFVENKPNSLFSEVSVTERPDSFAAKLYDGRIGIIIDGSPFALLIPGLFVENFQTVDDYTAKPYYATFLRWLRYFAYVFTIVLPGFYVALADFHPQLFPNSLLVNLSASVQTTPYPLLAECLVIHFIYEIMREGGLRMPKHIGHAVNIIGGLVIGDIVVKAGLIGAPLVLIVAISAITSFVVPDLYEGIVIMRFGFIIAGGLFGILGLALYGGFLVIAMCAKDNFGVPYMSPVSPVSFKALRDVVMRAGWHRLAKTDTEIQNMNGVNENE